MHRVNGMESNQEEQKPRSPRLRSLLGAKIMVKGQSSFDCIIKSKSESGFGLKMGSTAGVPDEFQLLEEKTGIIYDCVVAWRKSAMLGVSIVEPEE